MRAPGVQKAALAPGLLPTPRLGVIFGVVVDWQNEAGSSLMSETASEIAQRAKQLPPEERERLVDELLVSLNESAYAELDSAWSAEIERRLAAYDRGDVQAVSADEVLAKARVIAK